MNEGIVTSANKYSRKFSTQYIARIGILSAIAFIVMLIEFPIPALFPDWLKFDFSDIFALIGGVIMGPLAAFFIQLIKNLLKVATITKTAGIGELANLIAGVAYVLPVAFIYKKKRNIKGLILGLITGGITMTVIACVFNYFIILEIWLDNPTHDIKWGMIKNIFIGFNLLKSTVASIVSFIFLHYLKDLIKQLSLSRVN